MMEHGFTPRECEQHTWYCLCPSWLSHATLLKGIGQIHLEGHLSRFMEALIWTPELFFKNQGKPKIHSIIAAFFGKAITYPLIFPQPLY